MPFPKSYLWVGPTINNYNWSLATNWVNQNGKPGVPGNGANVYFGTMGTKTGPPLWVQNWGMRGKIQMEYSTDWPTPQPPPETEE